MIEVGEGGVVDVVDDDEREGTTSGRAVSMEPCQQRNDTTFDLVEAPACMQTTNDLLFFGAGCSKKSVHLRLCRVHATEVCVCVGLGY